MFLGRFFKMDPHTDDLLFDGSFLRNGMKVTVGDSSLRFEVTDAMDPYQLDQAEILNQWYTISYATIVNGGKYVAFIATYEDGRKRKLTFPIGQPWLVKLDTMPNKIDAETVVNPETLLLPVITREDLNRVNSRHGV
jgi:hypothetical protein